MEGEKRPMSVGMRRRISHCEEWRGLRVLIGCCNITRKELVEGSGGLQQRLRRKVDVRERKVEETEQM